MSQQHITNESAIFSLWLNWAVAVGALAIPEFVGLFVPKIWIPLITLGVMFMLILYRHTGGKFNASSCDLIQVICIRTLGISAVIMLIIAVIYARGYISAFYSEDVINTDIPFLSILIEGPVATALCIWHMMIGHSANVCRRCVIRYGTASERGFLGKIFQQESQYQLRFLLVLSALFTVGCWIYYWLFYINVNLNRFDRFAFNWIPTIFFILSIIYLGMRYFSLWGYYYNHIELNPRKRATTTTLRYIILCGDSVLLDRMDDFHDIPDANKYDTPAEIHFPSRERVDTKEALRVLIDMSNIEAGDFSMRFMYKSTDVSGMSNVFHYICCLESKDILDSTALHGKWFTLSQLQRLLYNHDLAPLMAAEIHRLYTVTMAWKTYDSEGRRLYKIKNYHPNFRLNGICDWDVDFDSPTWLDVARFNEDKPFFRLRRFLRRRAMQKG